MTDRQQKLFWLEIESIQKRHALFFSDFQKSCVHLREIDGETKLEIEEGSDISSVIVMEIELAFKLYSR
jgi:hypothetical protein